MQNDSQTPKGCIDGPYPLFGKIALKYRTITREQLEKATVIFNEKYKNNPEFPFSKVLIEENMASTDQIDLLQVIQEYWDARFAGEKFGSLAISKGYLSQKDITFALKIQKREFFSKKINQRIGDILVDQGILTDAQCSEIIAEQTKTQAPSLPKEESGAIPVNDPNFLDENEAGITDLERQYRKTLNRDRSFIEIAISKGFTSQLEIDRALLKQEMEYTIRKLLRTINEILIEEKHITEKQCDEVFEVLKQKINKKTDSSDVSMEHLRDFIKIVVSEDKLSAYIQIKKDIKDKVSVAFIKGLIDEKKITLGVIDKQKIADFIKNGLSALSTLKIAQGIRPQTVNDISVDYLFESNGVAGKKTSGKPPSVIKGDTIAKLEQMIQGMPGKDIFGNMIAPPPLADASLMCGNGVRLANNKKTLIASISGTPCKTLDGKFNVFSKTIIHEDADVRTGPIKGKTNIYIAGTLTGAFPVSGGTLSANEIRGANAKLTGDVTIATGITDAVIVTQGNVSAKYILNSKISAFLDVTVENEIIDSTVLTSGKCKVEKSRILASDITAKKGVFAVGIGSNGTQACNITVGTEGHIQSEINKIDTSIYKLRSKLDDKENKKSEFKALRDKINKKTKKLNAINSKAGKILTSLQKQTQNDKTKSLIEEVTAKKDETIVSLKKLGKEKKSVGKKIIKITKLIETISPGIQLAIVKLQKKKEVFLDWAKNKQGIPEIRVTGQVKKGTLFNGLNATVTIDEDCKNILSKEVKNQEEMVVIKK
ncbi:MAG: hypothetical protein B6I31_00560 [Desulfobacteraceae bacterium 4572_19]|nr:MAG: hypothetical protein B6I31_00560 [Desulfobacteraceae bacterium 4572_19]